MKHLAFLVGCSNRVFKNVLERIAALYLQRFVLGFLLLSLKTSYRNISLLQIHPEENEFVVKSALEEAISRGFELYDPFPDWHRRGLPLMPCSDKAIRVDAEKDQSDGFFLACFCRVQV